MELTTQKATLTLLLMIQAVPLFGQCSAASDVNDYLTCRIAERRAASAALKGMIAIKANGTRETNQQDATTVASQTTSLVDQSSASDLFNLALHMAKLSAGSNTNDTNSVTATTSLYALYAAANSHDPLDPEFYYRNRPWRRVYVTLGRDMLDTGVAGATQQSSNPIPGTALDRTHLEQTGTIGGVKVLIWDHRDVTSPANSHAFDTLSRVLGAATVNQAAIQAELVSRIANFNTRFGSLSPDEQNIVNSVIDARIVPFVQLRQVSTDIAQSIRTSAQWSLSYAIDKRNSRGYDEHKFQTIVDRGFGKRLNLTANGGYEFIDAKKFGRNLSGGTFAAEMTLRVTEDLTQPQPIMLSVSSQGEWLSRSKPVFKIQGKLTVPLGQNTGLEMPVSVTYANRADLIQESRVEGRFGFTFDAQKIAAALLGSAAKP